MKVQNENYYVIQGWMVNCLGLRGFSINVFAIIYGFSQDGESEFKGNREYLAKFSGASVRTIDKILHELVEQELITKVADNINGVIHNRYRVNLEKIKNFTSKKTLHNLIEEYGGNIKLLLEKWIKVLKAKGDIMTDEQLELNLESLEVYAKESNMTVEAYLKEVIKRGWKTFYPIQKKPVTITEHQGSIRTYSTEALNAIFDNLKYEDL